jgi:hypothetical protein
MGKDGKLQKIPQHRKWVRDREGEWFLVFSALALVFIVSSEQTVLQLFLLGIFTWRLRRWEHQ